MFSQGDVISYLDMCSLEGVNLQRGMNYRLKDGTSVVLMSLRPGAPYADQVRDEGTVLVYEGHDVSKTPYGPDPKSVDQPMHYDGGGLTQNGLFVEAAADFKAGRRPAELVRVYEKIRAGIWVFNGTFRLSDAWLEQSGDRKVFRFKLELTDQKPDVQDSSREDLENTRVIPTSVKLAVWQRDKGRCVKCGKRDNLHFDHVIPYAKGGSSITPNNIQLLCARHNLEKHDAIE